MKFKGNKIFTLFLTFFMFITPLNINANINQSVSEYSGLHIITPFTQVGWYATVTRTVTMTTTQLPHEVITVNAGQMVVLHRAPIVNGWAYITIATGNNRGARGSIHTNNLSSWSRP